MTTRGEGEPPGDGAGGKGKKNGCCQNANPNSNKDAAAELSCHQPAARRCGSTGRIDWIKDEFDFD